MSETGELGRPLLPSVHFEHADAAAGMEGFPPLSVQPIREVVLKVAEFCNIACDYCYMYEAVDQSFRGRPRFMDMQIIDKVARDMGGYARAYRVEDFSVVLHGGEPLLRPPEFFDEMAQTFQSRLGKIGVGFKIQTNATLLSDKHLEAFGRHNIGIGVSLDGDSSGNDRHRKFRNGKGSYELARAGLERMLQNEAYRHLFRNILCVIDTNNAPITTYKELCRYQPQSIDFLLPLGNWAHRPPGRQDNSPYRLGEDVPTPYADWLIPIFDQWAADSIQSQRDPSLPSVPSIRFFRGIIDGLLNRKTPQEVIGGVDSVGTMFFDTDGSAGLVDALKTTREHLTDLGVNAQDIPDINYFIRAHAIAERRLRAFGALGLPPLCAGCDIASVCGGGYYPHRYDESAPYDQGELPYMGLPSVYHPDLYKLIHHLQKFMFS